MNFAPPESLLRDEVEVEPEVLQHVGEVRSRRKRGRVIQELQVYPGELVRQLAGRLETCFFEVRVEFEFVFHGSSIPFLRGTLHCPVNFSKTSRMTQERPEVRGGDYPTGNSQGLSWVILGQMYWPVSAFRRAISAALNSNIQFNFLQEQRT